MLDLDNDEARKFVTGPGLIKVMRFLLHDVVVSVDIEACAVVGFQVRIGRLRSKAVEIRRKMAVKNHQWVARFGMFVESLRQ